MDEDDYGQYMHVKDPVVLASFLAFCSGNHNRVFLRGCCRNFPMSFPSLFRDQGSFCGDPKKRWSTYRCVLRKLRDLLTGTRWDRENLGAVLQHYGIKTPWLDVVRNLHTTILRWVVRYAETCEKRWRRFERPVGGSWRIDETFIKIWGQLMYLYRAVDGQGNTVEFYLSRTRGIAAAKAFFPKALKHHREPHRITVDGHPPSHSGPAAHGNER